MRTPLQVHILYTDGHRVERHAYVGCPHEHDGYYLSYIKEFRIVLVRGSCIRCKGSLWQDVSRHDWP